jgi:virginiamycin B lyase
VDRVDGDRPGDAGEHQNERNDRLSLRPTNIRRVFVDNSTTPVTFWVGSNDGASIVKLEPLD